MIELIQNKITNTKGNFNPIRNELIEEYFSDSSDENKAALHEAGLKQENRKLNQTEEIIADILEEIYDKLDELEDKAIDRFCGATEQLRELRE